MYQSSPVGLPAKAARAPAVRDVVQITDLSGSYQAIVNPNGQLIRGQSGNLTLNMRAARVALVYSGASKGWI